MFLKKLNPITSGTRHQLNLMKNMLSKNNNIAKKLTFKIKAKAGRSTKTGHITVRRKGGGCKKQFKKIKFNNFFTKNIILMVNYDSYRNAFISLNFDFLIKKFFFSTSVHTTFPGSIFLSSTKNLELYLGNSSLLGNFPISSLVHNVYQNICSRSLPIFSRSAGTFCQIIQKYKNKTQICLPSGKFIFLNSTLFATLGKVANTKFNLIVVGKAGKNRLKGHRPKVRGVAMNPVDHPHGGRTNGGRPSVSPWGKLTKGKLTSKKI